MSNRQDENNRYIPKAQQQKFIPKPMNPTPTSNSISTPFPVSLSSSLRQSDSSTTATSRFSAPDGSRIRMGDQGQLVPAQCGGNFVNYLPQDEAVAAGLGADDGGLDPVESQGVVDLLNRELTRLLKLNPREFWRQVASDASLHYFLDSFLQFRSRWYDFPFHGVKGIVAGVIVGELELCRRVFMVLYRISSNRDPGARAADSLSQKDHEVLLQDKKLLDLPKLLDICAIYGHENAELTKTLIENAVNSQTGIPESLNVMLSHFLGILHTMHHRCTSSLEVEEVDRVEVVQFRAWRDIGVEENGRAGVVQLRTGRDMVVEQIGRAPFPECPSFMFSPSKWWWLHGLVQMFASHSMEASPNLRMSLKMTPHAKMYAILMQKTLSMQNGD